MQTIYIEVKENYVSNVLKMLDGIKDIMINTVKLEPSNKQETEDTLMTLQSASMKRTWENDEDKAWDAL